MKWYFGLTAFLVASLPGSIFHPCAADAEWPIQFGNSSNNDGRGIVVDGAGNVLVTGNTANGILGQSAVGGTDGYVAKWDSAGNLQWARIFGTSAGESLDAITTTSTNGVVAGGTTNGSFPSYSLSGGSDGVVRLYDSVGATVWTRQFGTAGNEAIHAIAADGMGHIYVGGTTTGSFPGYTNPSTLFNDGYVTQLNAATGAVNWTYQFGVSGTDEVNALAADASGNIYVGGFTSGALPGQTFQGTYDAYTLKLNVNGTLQWVRQFGTSADDRVMAMTLDNAGELVVGGLTSGTLPGQTAAGSYDGFLRKFDANGNTLWTQQFGTAAYEYVEGVAVNGSNQIVAVGRTDGVFPGETGQGSTDSFVRVVMPDGTVAITRQFGTSGADIANEVAVDDLGNAYITGQTSGAFPGQTANGGTDGFVVQAIPEPSSGALIAGGVSLLGRRMRPRRA